MNIKKQKNCIENELSYISFKKRKSYLKDEKLLEYLSKSTNDKIPVSVNYRNLIFKSFIVPEKELSKKDINDLINWNMIDGYCSYGICCKNGQDFICSPTDNNTIEILKCSDPIIFLREIPEYYNIIELNQKIEHVLDLYEKEKGIYEVLTNIGDFKEVVIIENDEGRFSTFDEEYLKYYLYLSKSMLIRLFYIEFIDDEEFFWKGKQEEKIYKNEENELYFKLTTYSTGEVNTGYYRGFQIIRNDEKSSQLINQLHNIQEYETFEIFDENYEKKLVSCDPKLKEVFPLQPIFFKNEVLVNYKQNKSKYEVYANEIRCKGAWSLKYDLTESGLVHTFIKDIANIPYKEQLHWKKYNLASDEDLGELTTERYLHGSWEYGPTKLELLKYNLNNFPPIVKDNEEIFIWKMSSKLKERRNVDSITYIETDSIQEIETEVSFLHQAIIEGLKKDEINKLIIKEEGCEYSINALEYLLNEKNVDKNEIKNIIKPLRELNDYRKIVNHSGREYPVNFKNKTNELIDNLADSIDLIIKLIKSNLI